MLELTLANVIRELHTKLSEALAWQAAGDDRPDRGAYVSPEWALDDPSLGTAALAAGCGYFYLAAALRPQLPLPPADPAGLLQRGIDAMNYMLRYQRESGLIDLRSCNFDSGPDTAFVVETLCPLLAFGRQLKSPDPGWTQFSQLLEQFVRRAARGLANAGFHTPNHRWVMASAMAQASKLFPDLPVKVAIQSYLAEGIDIDPEGFYIERSPAAYDGVCNVSLLRLAEEWGFAAGRDAVRANLDLNLRLLHNDGTIETGLSRRFDAGQRVVPVKLAPAYLELGIADSNPVLLRAAQMLWERRGATSLETLCQLSRTLLACGEPPAWSADLPDDFSIHYPVNGLWRIRRGLLSASVFRGGANLLSLRHGRAELTDLQIAQSYFGVGQFIAETSQAAEGQVMLRHGGRASPRRPGYDLPLGQHVGHDRWEHVAKYRRYRIIPPCASQLLVKEASGGLDLCYRTTDGMDRVPLQIALDFAPGGTWETDACVFQPRAGQVIFLRQGTGRMRYGADVIEISPGAGAHRTWEMRDAQQAPASVRVLLTLTTPADFTFSIRAWRGPGDEPRP